MRTLVTYLQNRLKEWVDLTVVDRVLINDGCSFTVLRKGGWYEVSTTRVAKSGYHVLMRVESCVVEEYLKDGTYREVWFKPMNVGDGVKYSLTVAKHEEHMADVGLGLYLHVPTHLCDITDFIQCSDFQLATFTLEGYTTFELDTVSILDNSFTYSMVLLLLDSIAYSYTKDVSTLRGFKDFTYTSISYLLEHCNSLLGYEWDDSVPEDVVEEYGAVPKDITQYFSNYIEYYSYTQTHARWSISEVLTFDRLE